MTVFQSMVIGSLGDPQHGDLPAVAHAGQHLAEGPAVAGHLETHVEALLHPEVFLDLRQRPLPRVDAERGAHPGGEGAAARVGIGHHDVPRPGVTHDRGPHEPDRPRPGDQDVLPEHVEGERGVDRVPEGVEAGEDVGGDRGIRAPDVGHRDADELRVGAGAVHPHPLGVGTQVTPPGHAVAAASTDDVALAADQVARARSPSRCCRWPRPDRRTRGRRPAPSGSSSAPSRPSCRCGRRCRRCRSSGSG